MKFGLIAIFAFLLTGCGASGPAFEQINLDSNQSKSEIIVFRKNQFVDGGSCYQVNVNGKELGILANGGFLRTIVDPAKHKIVLFSVRDNVLELEVSSTEHSTNYIEYNTSLAGGHFLPIGSVVSFSTSFDSSLAEVEPEYALTILKDLKESSKTSCMGTIREN